MEKTYVISDRMLSGIQYFNVDALMAFPSPEELARLPKYLQTRLNRVKLTLEFTDKALREAGVKAQKPAEPLTLSGRMVDCGETEDGIGSGVY